MTVRRPDVVALDSSALWSGIGRDFLLQLAANQLYQPLWSGALLTEVERNEVRRLTEAGHSLESASTRAQRLLEQMRDAFPEANVEGWEYRIGQYGLRDPNDEHVLAAADVGGASRLVTLDRDFEIDKMPAGIGVLTPSEFTAELSETDALRVIDSLRDVSSRYVRPEMTVPELLGRLEDKHQMAGMAANVRGLVLHNAELRLELGFDLHSLEALSHRDPRDDPNLQEPDVEELDVEELDVEL